MAGSYQTFLNSIKKEGFNPNVIFKSSNFGVAVYSHNEKNNNFVFLDLNKRGAKISEKKRSEVLGKKVTKAFPGIDKFGLLNVFRAVKKTGKSIYHPVSLYKDSKIVQWLENYVYRLPAGQIVAIYNEVKTDDAKKREREKEKNCIPIVSFLIIVFLSCLIFIIILFAILTTTGSHDLFSRIAPLFGK